VKMALERCTEIFVIKIKAATDSPVIVIEYNHIIYDVLDEVHIVRYA
jgi:hypothetical protein